MAFLFSSYERFHTASPSLPATVCSAILRHSDSSGYDITEKSRYTSEGVKLARKFMEACLKEEAKTEVRKGVSSGRC